LLGKIIYRIKYWNLYKHNWICYLPKAFKFVMYSGFFAIQCQRFPFKMLCLYLLGHKCFYRKKYICWKCLARKVGFVYLRFDPLRRNSNMAHNRYSQLTRRCSSNASALGARGLGFNPRLRQGFLFFVLLLLCFYFYCSKTHCLLQKFAISFAMLIYLIYLTYCKICDRL